MIRILVVDDQTLVRQGFRAILETQPDFDVAGEAGDGIEAVARARELQPDVVVMDIRMPRLDGIEATRRICASGRRTRVLVLTTFDLDSYVYEALKAGASGFLLKDGPREDLIAAIRNVFRGDSLLAPTVTKRIIERFLKRPAPESGSVLVSTLSERELEVLRLIAAARTNAEIATALFVSETTVKSHVAHILRKLDLRDRVHVVVFAYESGLVEPGG